MSDLPNTGFADRLKTSAEAKKALLAKFKTRPTVTDPLFAEREAMKAAELERVREERAKARAAEKQAIADAEQASASRTACSASATRRPPKPPPLWKPSEASARSARSSPRLNRRQSATPATPPARRAETRLSEDGQTGRNRLTARTPTAMKARSTMPWAMPNGGSEPVGARACSAGSLANACTTSTKTLK